MSRDPLRAGDYSRLLRENLGDAFGPLALITITAPGASWKECPCCGEVPLFALTTPGEITAWNVTSAPRWQQFRHHLKIQLRREYGLSPPLVLARVAQRQSRGADHLHMAVVCRTDRHREQISRWVALYRRLHVSHGFGYVDDPLKLRKSSTGAMVDLVFEDGKTMGSYLGGYLTGGQFESFLSASDTSFNAVWIHRGLTARTGFTLERCKWLREAHLLATGVWRRGVGGDEMRCLETRYPSWWFVPEHREWVLRHSEWDGVIGSRATSLDPVGVSPVGVDTTGRA